MNSDPVKALMYYFYHFNKISPFRLCRFLLSRFKGFHQKPLFHEGEIWLHQQVFSFYMVLELFDHVFFSRRCVLWFLFVFSSFSKNLNLSLSHRSTSFQNFYHNRSPILLSWIFFAYIFTTVRASFLESSDLSLKATDLVFAKYFPQQEAGRHYLGLSLISLLSFRKLQPVFSFIYAWDQQIRTVNVSNVSLGATEQDIKEFFSFSGDIECVELRRVKHASCCGNEYSQIAYVTFKDPQGAETALLLSGATIVDHSVCIALAEVPTSLPPPPPVIPASAPPLQKDGKVVGGSESAVRKAEDAVTTMLAKGFVLGKDVINKAKSFDERHQLTSTASAKVSSLDKKIGFTEKVSMGTAVVNEKVKEMDQKFHVSDKTKSKFAVAKEKVSDAGSAVISNRYVLTGASWVTGAFKKATKAAQGIGSKAKRKGCS